MNNQQNYGLIRARQRIKRDNPGIFDYLMQQAKQSVKGLINPLHLIPSILMIVIWYVLSLTAGNIAEKTGSLNLPVWHKMVDFLTYSQGGMYGWYIAAFGSIIGKAVVMAFLNSVLIAALEKKRPFTNVASGIKNLTSALDIRNTNEVSPLLSGCGFALIAYGLMNSRQAPAESVIGIYAILMILKNMGENGGFLTGLIISGANSFGCRRPSDKTVHRMLTGGIFGFVSGILLSFTGLRLCMWIGLILLILSLIFKPKKNTRAVYSMMIAVMLITEMLFTLMLTEEAEAAAGFSSSFKNGGQEIGINIDGGSFKEGDRMDSGVLISGSISAGEGLSIYLDSNTDDHWIVIARPDGTNEVQKELKGKLANFTVNLTDSDNSSFEDSGFLLSGKCASLQLDFWNGNSGFFIDMTVDRGNHSTGTMDDYCGIYRVAEYMPYDESVGSRLTNWEYVNGKTLDSIGIVYKRDGQYNIAIFGDAYKFTNGDDYMVPEAAPQRIIDSLDSCGSTASLFVKDDTFSKMTLDEMMDLFSSDPYYWFPQNMESEWDENTHTITSKFQNIYGGDEVIFDYTINAEFSLADDGTLRVKGHQYCYMDESNLVKKYHDIVNDPAIIQEAAGKGVVVPGMFDRSGDYSYCIFDFEGIKLDRATGKDMIYSKLPGMDPGDGSNPGGSAFVGNDGQQNNNDNNTDNRNDNNNGYNTDNTGNNNDGDPFDFITPDMREMLNWNDWDEHVGTGSSAARTTAGSVGALIFGIGGAAATGLGSGYGGYGYRVSNEGDISFNDPGTGREFKYYYTGQDPATGEGIYISNETTRYITGSEINSVYASRYDNAAYYRNVETDAAVNNAYIRQHTEEKLQQDKRSGKTEAERDIANAVFRRQFDEKMTERFGERYKLDPEGVKREIRQKQIADGVAGDHAMVRSVWMNYGEQTASQVSTVADVAINVLGEITGPAGKSIKRIYSYVKPGLSKYTEALVDGKRGMEVVKDVGQAVFEAGMDHINDVSGSYKAQVITGGLKTGLAAYRDDKNITEELEKGFVKDTFTWGIGQLVDKAGDYSKEAKVAKLTEGMKAKNMSFRNVLSKERFTEQTKALNKISFTKDYYDGLKSIIKDTTSQVKFDFNGGSGFGNYQENFDPDNATGWIDDTLDNIGDWVHSGGDLHRNNLGISNQDIVRDMIDYGTEKLKDGAAWTAETAKVTSDMVQDGVIDAADMLEEDANRVMQDVADKIYGAKNN